jgi:hypothetical protein
MESIEGNVFLMYNIIKLSVSEFYSIVYAL